MPDRYAKLDSEWLSAFIDGRLDADTHAVIARHLARHPQDAARVTAYGETERALQDMHAAALQAPQPESLRHVLDDDAIEGSAGGNRAGARRLSPRLTLLAVGLLCFAVGWFASFLRPHSRAVATAFGPVTRAVRAYRLFAANDHTPVSYGHDQIPAFRHWFEHTVGAQPVIPSLHRAGYSIARAYVLPADAATAGQVVYRNGADTRLSLYFELKGEDSLQPADSAHAYFRQKRLSVYRWSAGPATYVIVAPVSMQHLKDLVGRMGG